MPVSWQIGRCPSAHIRELVRMICGKLGVAFDELVDLVDDRPGKDAAYLLDSTKARRTLGWADSITLEKGIDETIAWVTENLDELKKQSLDYIHKS